MSGSGAGAPCGEVESLVEELDPIAEILAFFAATRNYGYVDTMANALDASTALEALNSALRDYDSACLAPERPDPRELGAWCPLLGRDAEMISRAVEVFASRVPRLDTACLVLLLRRLAARAYARAPRLRWHERGGKSEGGGGEG